MKSHISWREERNIHCKGAKTLKERLERKIRHYTANTNIISSKSLNPRLVDIVWFDL